MKTRCFSELRLALLSVIAFAVTVVFHVHAQTGGGSGTIPVVTIRASDPIASESGNPGQFTLFRDGPTNLALNVFLAIEGTASNGVDYATIPYWIPIPPGVRSVPIPVHPIDDPLSEGQETVALRLFYPPIMAPLNYVIGQPSNAIVTIEDNDPTPSNRPPFVSIQTPGSGAILTAPVNIHLAAAAEDPDAGDHVATVEFFQNGISLGVTTNNPLSMSPINPFSLVWSNVPPGEYVLTARATDSHGASRLSGPVPISVRPPPLPVVTIQATDPYTSEPGFRTVVDPGVFTVTRTGGTNLDLPVYYSIHGTASNGVDYPAIPGTVVIPAGKTSANVVILPWGDNLKEGTETLVLHLEEILCIAIYPPPPDCYLVGTPREAVVCIEDFNQPTNLPPQVRLVKPLEGQTFPAPTNILMIADTVDSDGYVYKVEFFADNYKIGEQQKHFLVRPPPGQHIPYDFVWSNAPVGRHTLTARATDHQGASAMSGPVTIWVVTTNLPPPPPIVSITATDPVASEGTNCCRWIGWPATAAANFCGTNTATFVVRRQGPTNDALTVHYCIGGTAANGLDYAELSGTVNLPAGQRATPIVIVPLDDSLPERIETVVLRLFVPPTILANVPPYLIGGPARAAAIIVDNDHPRPETGMLPDRCFHVMKPGDNGTWWRIECSSDMIHWTPLGTNLVTDGALHFVDPDAEESPQRFYRAVPEANPPEELP